MADGKIATVTDGKVAAVAAGETTLTATAGDVEMKIPVTVAKAEDKPEETPEPTPESAPAPEPAPAPAPEPEPKPAPTPTPAPHTHNYSYTRTEPTCTADGKIVKKCSCGDTKTTVLPALGHDYSVPVYEEQTYEVVEYECHMFCAACGLDFDAAGYTNSQLSDHMKAHALKGESDRSYDEWIEVKKTISETVIVGHKCSRCGAVQPK